MLLNVGRSLLVGKSQEGTLLVLVLVHHPSVASKCLGPMLFDPGETPTSKFMRKR